MISDAVEQLLKVGVKPEDLAGILRAFELPPQQELSPSAIRMRRHRARNSDVTSDDGLLLEDSTKIEIEKDNKPNVTPRHILMDVLDETHADAVIEHRKAKRSPLKAHSAKLLVAQLAKTDDPNAAADVMMVRGWTGFEPSWVENNKQKQQPPPFVPSGPKRTWAEIQAERKANGQG